MNLTKTLVTVGVFVSLFVEFGGGMVAVSRSGFADGSIFYRANPEMPGFVGKTKARLTGRTLPEPYVPVSSDYACTLALDEGRHTACLLRGAQEGRQVHPHHVMEHGVLARRAGGRRERMRKARRRHPASWARVAGAVDPYE